jgi:hypothetical protein
MLLLDDRTLGKLFPQAVGSFLLSPSTTCGQTGERRAWFMQPSIASLITNHSQWVSVSRWDCVTNLSSRFFTRERQFGVSHENNGASDNNSTVKLHTRSTLKCSNRVLGERTLNSRRVAERQDKFVSGRQINSGGINKIFYGFQLKWIKTRKDSLIGVRL